MQLASLPWWVFALLSAFFAALTTIFAKLGIQNVSSNLATAIRTVVILFIAWAIVLGTGEVKAIGTIGTRTWAMLVLSAVATGLSWLCYFRALQIGEAFRVVPVDKFSVVLVAVIAFLVLGERPSPREWLGIALIGAGLAVMVLKRT